MNFLDKDGTTKVPTCPPPPPPPLEFALPANQECALLTTVLEYLLLNLLKLNICCLEPRCNQESKGGGGGGGGVTRVRKLVGEVKSISLLVKSKC